MDVEQARQPVSDATASRKLPVRACVLLRRTFRYFFVESWRELDSRSVTDPPVALDFQNMDEMGSEESFQDVSAIHVPMTSEERLLRRLSEVDRCVKRVNVGIDRLAGKDTKLDTYVFAVGFPSTLLLPGRCWLPRTRRGRHQTAAASTPAFYQRLKTPPPRRVPSFAASSRVITTNSPSPPACLSAVHTIGLWATLPPSCKRASLARAS